MVKRIICIGLLCVMLLTACSQGKATDNGIDTSVQTESQTETTALKYLDSLPAKDYDGAKFRISVTDKYEYEMYTEKENGDVCNDAIFRRNLLIEDKYNVKISTLVSVMEAADDHNVHPDFIKKSVMSGDDVFDLAAMYVYRAGTIIEENMFLGWNSIPNVDLGNPWWVQRANDAFTIHSKQYIAISDLSITAIQLAYGILFNHEIAQSYQIDDLYTTVLDGTWTIDKMNAISKTVYSDLNGNSKKDQGDLYGYIGSNSTDIDLYPAAFGIRYTEINSDGNLNIAIDQSRMADAVEKIYTLYWGDGSNVESYYWDIYDRFKDNQALFIPCCLITLYNQLRDMKTDYGILPTPKLNETQDEYLTNEMDNYSALGVPVTAVNLEMIGSIVEALSAESKQSVVPVFYETALQDKYSRDSNSLAILDIIMEGRTYDFCILYGMQLMGLPYLVRTLINEKKSDWVSKYTSIETKLLTEINKLNEIYTNIN